MDKARKEALQTKQLLDDAIDDEVDEIFNDELMSTEVGKSDAKKLRDLIGKIDYATEKQTHKVEVKIDNSNKYASSSKIVVSKYQKNGLKPGEISGQKGKGIGGIQSIH